jgi:hypothetical protein
MREEWYGGAILLTDGLSLASAVAAVFTQSSAPAAFALGGYALGGPIVHVAHGEPLRGLGSLGLRAGLPVVGGLSGALLASVGPPERCHDVCGLRALGGLLVGTGVGAVAAMVVDTAFLARRKVPAEATTGVTVTPQVAVDKKGVQLGLGGAF